MTAQDRSCSLAGNVPRIKASSPVDSLPIPFCCDYVYDYFADNKKPFDPWVECMELMRLLNHPNLRIFIVLLGSILFGSAPA